MSEAEDDEFQRLQVHPSPHPHPHPHPHPSTSPNLVPAAWGTLPSYHACHGMAHSKYSTEDDAGFQRLQVNPNPNPDPDPKALTLTLKP